MESRKIKSSQDSKHPKERRPLVTEAIYFYVHMAQATNTRI